MSNRFPSKEAFHEAVTVRGLPVSDAELDALWEMVRGLHDQADNLRQYLDERLGPNPLTAP